MKSTITKNGHTFTTYTASKPYKVEGDAQYFKQLVTWDNSRIGRVVYDRGVHVSSI